MVPPIYRKSHVSTLQAHVMPKAFFLCTYFCPQASRSWNHGVTAEAYQQIFFKLSASESFVGLPTSLGCRASLPSSNDMPGVLNLACLFLHGLPRTLWTPWIEALGSGARFSNPFRADLKRSSCGPCTSVFYEASSRLRPSLRTT